MLTAVYILLGCVYFFGGLVTLARNQYPIRGKRIVVGQHAQTIGVVWVSFGAASLVGYMITGENSNPIRLVIQIMQFGIIIFTYQIYRRHAGDIDSFKVQPRTAQDVFTVHEAARYLKVEDVYVLHLIEDGQLKAKAIGGDYRISRRSIEDYLQS